jgi:hypothetical protein
MSDLRKLLEVTTPGPWIERWDEDGGAFVTGNNYVRAHMVGPESNRRANARLIALAPDLAAALLEAEEALDCAQSALAVLLDPEANKSPSGVSIQSAWASCFAAEVKARATLTEIRKITGAK